MEPIEIIAQGLGMIGLVLNALSFQRRTKTQLIATQLISAAAFSLHFLLLNAPTGCILNAISVFRAIVFTNEEKFKAKRLFWLPIFFLLFFTTYVLVFTKFGVQATAKNLIIELMPVIAMCVSTISFRTKNAATVRKLSLINSPLWLVYDFLTGSIGGTAGETINLVSIIIGIIRLDIKKAEKQ
jgi:hypothetical protein